MSDSAEGPQPPRPVEPKRFNETLKEFCAFVRGIALAVVIFGATRFALSVLAGVALQAANLYILRRPWQKE